MFKNFQKGTNAVKTQGILFQSPKSNLCDHVILSPVRRAEMRRLYNDTRTMSFLPFPPTAGRYDAEYDWVVVCVFEREREKESEGDRKWKKEPEGRGGRRGRGERRHQPAKKLNFSHF